MSVCSGSLGSGAFAFFRKKTGSDLNGGMVHETRSDHPSGNDPLPIARSDFLLARSAEQAEARGDPFVQTASSYVGQGCQIIGQAFFDRSIRIDGQVEGTVGARDRIAVGPTGTITTADPITAAEVIIEGTVRGNVVASERIEIGATADVMGSLCAPIIKIEAGAVIEGYCSTAPRQKWISLATDRLRILPASNEKT